jgi:hypothetical protein
MTRIDHRVDDPVLLRLVGPQKHGDDLTNGRRMELEALHGTGVRLARRHDISVLVSETIYAILRPWAVRNEVAAGS